MKVVCVFQHPKARLNSFFFYKHVNKKEKYKAMEKLPTFSPRRVDSQEALVEVEHWRIVGSHHVPDQVPDLSSFCCSVVFLKRNKMDR